MVKGGKLTKAEIFYIEQNPDNKTIVELSVELNRSQKMVAKYYKEKQVEVKQEPVPVESRPESPMFQLMGRHERQGKHVATVMTKAASELADATRTSRLEAKNKLASAIHKPKG